MAFVTMWFANLAEVNPGIITVIWALGPLYSGLADRIFYKTELKAFHWIGMVMIILCAILIALSGVLVQEPIDEDAVVEVAVLGSWAPVIMAALTPICFAASAIIVKHMTG